MCLDSRFKKAEQFLAEKDIERCFDLCNELEQLICKHSNPVKKALRLKKLNKIKVALNLIVVNELRKSKPMPGIAARNNKSDNNS